MIIVVSARGLLTASMLGRYSSYGDWGRPTVRGLDPATGLDVAMSGMEGHPTPGMEGEGDWISTSGMGAGMEAEHDYNNG